MREKIEVGDLIGVTNSDGSPDGLIDIVIIVYDKPTDFMCGSGIVVDWTRNRCIEYIKVGSNVLFGGKCTFEKDEWFVIEKNHAIISEEGEIEYV